MGDSIDEMFAHLTGIKPSALAATKPFVSKEKREALLAEFAKQRTDYPVGAKLQRNGFGKVRYKYPADGEYGILVERFPYPVLDDDGHMCHGALAMCLDYNGEPVTLVYCQDLRYYEEATDEKKSG